MNEKDIARRKRYIASPAKKEELKRYRQTANGKLSRKRAEKRYLKSASRKEACKRYYESHKAARLYFNKIWRQENPSYIAQWTRIRRNQLSKCIPKWHEVDLVGEIYRKRDELNKRWNLVGKERFEVDHIVPINPVDESVCGLHCFDNLQLLRKSNNSSKSDTYTSDW